MRAFVVALLVGLMSAATPAAQAPSVPNARKVTLNAFNESGGYVEDLRADDLTVKENGKTRDIVAVRPAKLSWKSRIIALKRSSFPVLRSSMSMRSMCMIQAPFS